MMLQATAMTAGVCGLLLLGTAIDTVRQRLRLMAAHGDMGDARLISATRSHGNLAEHAPLVLILLGLAEASGRCPWLAWTLAGAFIVGRLAHVWGLYHPRPKGPPPARSLGVVLTWLCLGTLSVWVLLLARG